MKEKQNKNTKFWSPMPQNNMFYKGAQKILSETSSFISMAV